MTDIRFYLSDTEIVARLLHRHWVTDGVVQHYAFALRPKETYISVNRLAISTCDSDVAAFVTAHPDFYADGTNAHYMRAVY